MQSVYTARLTDIFRMSFNDSYSRQSIRTAAAAAAAQHRETERHVLDCSSSHAVRRRRESIDEKSINTTVHNNATAPLTPALQQSRL